MRTSNNKNRIDNSSGIGQDNTNKAMQPASETKKTPWHLRFAPGAILRKKAIIAAIAVVAVTVTVLTTIKANPAAGAIKYAIPVVTWLVAAIGENLVGKALDDYLAAAEGQKAYATVRGAQWITNEYEKKVESKYEWLPNYTTMADMGKEDELNSAVGWDGPNKKSMTQAQVQAILNDKRAKGTIISASGIISYKKKYKEVEWRRGFPSFPIATNIVVGEFLTTIPDYLNLHNWVTARKDQFERAKARAVHNLGVKMQEDAYEGRDRAKAQGFSEEYITNNIFIPYDFKWKEDSQRKTWKYNLGSMELVSIFEDEHPILPELGTGPDEAIDGDANYYNVEVTLSKSPLLPNGLWGAYVETRKNYTFKAWETHHRAIDICEENERITDPQVYDGITRYVADRNKLEYQVRLTPSMFGPIRTGSWRIVGADSVVVHDPRATKPR